MSRLHGALFAVARAADALDDPPPALERALEDLDAIRPGWRERPATAVPTPEQTARVRALAAQGYTDAGIAAELGVPRRTARTWRRALPPLDPDQALRERTVAGASAAEIAGELGVSAKTVRERQRRAGLRTAEPRPAPVADEALRSLFAEGLGAPAIAERTGLAEGTVRNRLSRLGLRADQSGRGRPRGSGS